LRGAARLLRATLLGVTLLGALARASSAGAAGGEGAGEGAGEVEVPVDRGRAREGWGDLVRLLADRDLLARRLGPALFAPLPSPRALVGRVERGTGGQPRLYYYSYLDTAFRDRDAHFHPASTVKLAAAVGALISVGRYALTGAAEVEMRGLDGPYRGPLRDLIYEALMHSSNPSYNLLMEIAGLDEVNERLLSPRWGLPTYELRSRYGGRARGKGFRDSPEVRLREGGGEVLLPPRRGRSAARRGCGGNCTTLAELHELQRRLFLADELPEEERLPLHVLDRDLLRDTMLKARDRLKGAPRALLGAGARVYNNVGRLPGTSVQEVAYLEAADGRDRVFVAVAVGFPRALRDDNTRTVSWLEALCLESARVARAAPLEGPGLQHPWGEDVSLRVWRRGGRGRAEVQARPGRRVRLWVNRARVYEGAAQGAQHAAEFALPPSAAPLGVAPALAALTVEVEDLAGAPRAYWHALVDLSGVR